MGKRFIFLIGFFVLLLSCEKEWNALEPWEENYAVFSSLNLKDTAQYVRINRLFHSEDNPNFYTQVPDSVHVHPQDFEVYLEHWKDGTLAGNPIIFYPSNDFQKEDGNFTKEGYFVYKTTQRLAIDSEYKLMIRNIRTGFQMEATAPTFGRRTLHQSFLEKRYFHIAQYKPERLDYSGNLMPDQFEKMVQRLLYLEISPTDTIEKILDWRPWLYHLGLEQKNSDTAQFTDAYFEYIGECIPAKAGVKRLAVGVDKLLIVNSEELDLFIDLSNTGSTLYYDPNYTNFSRGAGFFGFRYYYTFFAIELADITLDSLAQGSFTKHLNFADSEGNWHRTE
jgi:hypothetical protein